MRALRIAAAAFALVTSATRLAAQDSINRITLGVRGVSAAQPGLAVVAGPGLDSVLAIVRRDLEFSDRFTMPPRSFDSVAVLRGPFNPGALKSSGLTWVVELQPAVGGVDVRLYDIATGTIRQQSTMAADLSGVKDTRLSIHRISDQVVTWTTGGVGMASTRIAFKMKDGRDDAIWRIDSDGANPVRVTRGLGIFEMPAWSPDGAAIAYDKYADGHRTMYLQRLSTGTLTIVNGSSRMDSYGANFSPDGKTLVYTHGLEQGSGIETADIARTPCCAHVVTHDGRFADNLSPTYSPDGRRIAYVSTRTGTPEIYAVDEDGTDRTQLVPSNFETGGGALPTYSPAWSADGTRIAFSRDTRTGGRQVYVMSLSSGQTMQVTSAGRNEDQSWAPDSRHIVFKSNRSGREQLWILDVESNVTRQLATSGDIRYPAWSRILGNP
jgi:TolB protein